MSEALALIHIPAVMPKGVTRRQWRLAALLPQCESAAEAMRLAGYSIATIDKKSGRQTGLDGVRRAAEAIAAQNEARLDRARGIKAKVAAVVEANVRPDMDEQLALATYATVSKIAAEYPEGESETGVAELNAYRAERKRLIRRAARLALVMFRRLPVMVDSQERTTLAE